MMKKEKNVTFICPSPFLYDVICNITIFSIYGHSKNAIALKFYLLFMKIKRPKRLAIFGLPGSGKSTFANKLGKMLNIPTHHLDRHYFIAKWKMRPRHEFLAVQKEMIQEDSWIIEGNSIATLEMRFARADTVIYFHLPRYLCLWRIFKRPFDHDDSLLDIPEGCSKNGMNWSLLKYLWTFDKQKNAKISELKMNYPDVEFHVFKSSIDAEKFLKKMENSN